MIDTRLAAVIVLTLSSAGLAAGQFPTPQQARLPQPQQPAIQEPRGAIWGVVVSGTTGQPVDRVRLRLSGDGLRGSRTVYSDDAGRFAFLDLPPGAYLLSGSKSGYVDITYGQRSPNAGRAGTPIQVAVGQQIEDLSFVLPPGGVITGRLFDERSRPSVATTVRVMRWEYGDGHRELSSEGSAQTDDRGVYRVYGLPPGNYIVSAMPRNTGVEQSLEMQLVLDARLAQRSRRGLRAGGGGVTWPEVERSVATPDEPALGYAPAYYPGTLDLGAAQAVSVGVSQEVTGVDFVLQQVPLARVEGMVVVRPGVDARSMRLRLYNTAHDVPGVGSESSRVRDVTFSFTGVPPGQYRAVVTAEIELDQRGPGAPPLPAFIGGLALAGRGDDDEILLWGSAEVTVSGQDVSNVSLVLLPGITVSGRIAYDGSRPPPETEGIRVSLEPFGPAAEAAGADDSRATVDENGGFTITGVIPAKYRVEASGVPGWEVTSAMLNGVETLDFGLDASSAQDLTGMQIVYSDTRTELSGTLQDPMGSPTSAYTVVVFPADPRYWLPSGRRIQGTRPTTTGRFSFSGLPPGQYRLAALTDVETGIWYDPTILEQIQAASIPISLGRGESVTQDLRVGR